jgi:hypothetical protein
MRIRKMIMLGSLPGVLLFMLTGCYSDQVLPMDPVVIVGEVSFKEDLIPIFNNDCNGSGCHNGSVKPNLLPANAYSSLLNGGYINKTDPSASSLYKWMTGDKGTPMPPAGTNATYNAKVLAWIEQGALNN